MPCSCPQMQQYGMLVSTEIPLYVYSGRSSDFRFVLLAASSRSKMISDIHAAFVPDYSGGPVLDSHQVPFFTTFVAPELWENLKYFSLIVKGRDRGKQKSMSCRFTLYETVNRNDPDPADEWHLLQKDQAYCDRQDYSENRDRTGDDSYRFYSGRGH